MIGQTESEHPELDAVISLGAGVQSSTMLLMAARGAFDKMPVGAIFADTGWEPQGVYEHLDWLEEQVAGTIPIHRVTAGNLRDDLVEALETGRKWVGIPLHVRGERRGTGQLHRQCTRQYKVDPITRQLRAMGYGAKNPVEQWIGISLDEFQRVKPSRTPWQKARWPLIEQSMTRTDCLSWFGGEHPGRTLAKSACIGCPFHNTAGWREVKRDPEQWADATEIDEMIRASTIQTLDADTKGFLHYSRKPLSEVDLSTPEERGQLTIGDFEAECEGMCGV